jgi:hypothetical protein
MNLAIHLHLVPTLKMREAVPPFSPMSSWRGAYLRVGTTSPDLTSLNCYERCACVDIISAKLSRSDNMTFLNSAVKSLCHKFCD